MTSEDDPYVIEPNEDKEFEEEAFDLGEFLDKLKYPVEKSKIIEKALKVKMADEMRYFLEKISNRTYESAIDVMNELAEGHNL